MEVDSMVVWMKPDKRSSTDKFVIHPSERWFNKTICQRMNDNCITLRIDLWSIEDLMGLRDTMGYVWDSNLLLVPNFDVYVCMFNKGTWVTALKIANH